MTSCSFVHVFPPLSNCHIDGSTQPISAAVWDTAPEKLFNEFPVRTLVQFMNNHNLLQIIGAPDWLTIGGGR
jgi:predicted NAD/FAD-binding protein